MPLIDEPGTIVIPCGELPRYHQFEDSMLTLSVPPGTQVIKERSPNIAANLNIAIKKRVGKWTWLLGDDHQFEPDCLMRLLWHDVDMVAPLVYKKTIPPHSVAYRDGYGATAPFEEIALDDFPSPEARLMPVSAVGGAGLLVKNEVFDALKYPWFEIGKLQSDIDCEDLYFVSKAINAGFSCYIDLGTVMGHTAPGTFWPVYQNGRWTVEIRFGSRYKATLNPPPKEKQEEPLIYVPDRF